MDMGKINNELNGSTPQEILKWAFDTFDDKILRSIE